MTAQPKSIGKPYPPDHHTLTRLSLTPPPPSISLASLRFSPSGLARHCQAPVDEPLLRSSPSRPQRPSFDPPRAGRRGLNAGSPHVSGSLHLSLARRTSPRSDSPCRPALAKSPSPAASLLRPQLRSSPQPLRDPRRHPSSGPPLDGRRGLTSNKGAAACSRDGSSVSSVNLFNVLSLSVGLRVVVVTLIIMLTNTCAIFICLCVFMYACQLCRMIGYDRTDSVFSFCLFVDCSLSTHFRSNWFAFDIPRVRLVRFRYRFRIKM